MLTTICGEDDDGDDDNDGDYDYYVSREKALEEAGDDFVLSLFDWMAKDDRERGDFGSGDQTTWGPFDKDEIVQAATRAVVERLEFDTIDNPSHTTYSINITVKGIQQPSDDCPLSVEFEVKVNTRDPEKCGFSLWTFVRGDEKGKWAVDAEEDSTDTEEDNAVEGWSPLGNPSSVG
jgi:hypothetical protein